MGRQIDRQVNRQIDRQIDKWINIIDRQIDRSIDRLMDGWMDRQRKEGVGERDKDVRGTQSESNEGRRERVTTS